MRISGVLSGLLVLMIAVPGVSQQTPSSATPPAPSQTGAPEAAPEGASQQQKNAPAAAALPSMSSAATAALKPGVDNAHYVIGPEDGLQITVWREPTLSGTIPVRPDGMISMVLIGDMPAAGFTPMHLSEEIAKRLRKYVQDPSVTVQVMAVNSQRIYLMGEVGHVGAVNLTAGMTPLQAIAAAGGLTNFANSKRIYILRGAGAKQQKIPFNYKQALKGDSHQLIALQPGDTIVVP